MDQTGENIIFVTNGNSVEAHIQIQYTGDPPKFAWVIPVQSIPQFSVGSQPFFDALLQRTVPSVSRQDVACGPNGGITLAGVSSAQGASSGGPQVVSREMVGSFDVTVLQGGTAAEVVNWLATNGYAQDPEAEPILEQYLSANYMFAAVKLLGGRGLQDLHPLVLTSNAARPCVPLKLTRIASVPNMGIRTFFLGDRRTVPVRYAHVEYNQIQLDWMNRGANYRNVISQAVDDPAAGGRAFVTEFAGQHYLTPSSVRDPLWDAQPFSTIAVLDVITQLAAQNLVRCTGGSTCTWLHPLVRSLVNKYVPVPATLEEGDFYANLSTHAALVDMMAWSAAAFAQELDQLVIQPGEHAAQLLAQHNYVTRLFTTMDGAEMTEDPEFETRDGLPDVTNYLNALLRPSCSEAVSITELPDGHHVNMIGRVWPVIPNMPYAATVQLYPADGVSPPITLADRKDTINALLNAHNAANPVDLGGVSGSGSSTMTASTSQGGSGAAASSIGGTSMLPGSSALSQPGPPVGGGAGGGRFNCRCVGTPEPNGAAAILLLGACALARRRRRGRLCA